MRLIVALIPTIVVLAGCANSDRDLMPLSLGENWSYMAHPGLDSYPDNVRVTRKLAIDDVEGWELTGDLGVSHFAWSHGRLITDQLSGARFTPALPLLVSEGHAVAWQGWVYTLGRKEPARAVISRTQDKQDFQGQNLDETLSTVKFKVSNRQMELKTWFAPSIGIVKQEQLTNRRLDMDLVYLGKT